MDGFRRQEFSERRSSSYTAVVLPAGREELWYSFKGFLRAEHELVTPS